MWLWVIVVSVIIILVAVTILWSRPPDPPGLAIPPVTITAVDGNFTGPSSWGWGNMPRGGTLASPSDQATASIYLIYTAGLSQPNTCTVTDKSIQTPGFSIVRANTPLVVSSGGNGTPPHGNHRHSELAVERNHHSPGHGHLPLARPRLRLARVAGLGIHLGRFVSLFAGPALSRAGVSPPLTM